MPTPRNNWQEPELIEALKLYLVTPFGRLHKGNPDVVALAERLGRSVNAVSWKLVNFASLDPEIVESGRKGASNSSKLDQWVWNEYAQKGIALFDEEPIEQGQSLTTDIATEAIRSQKVRLRQGYFRKMVLAAYDYKCAVSGISVPELLIASHITPWSADESLRLEPSNGLCLSSLYDKAFEVGLIGIEPTPDYRIQISPLLKDANTSDVYERFFGPYQNRSLNLPSRSLPSLEALERHYHERFKR